MRILVVEDEPNVRSIARRSLESYGSTVDAAADVESACALLRDSERVYHVIVIDRVLPDACGDEVAAEAAVSQPGAGIVLTSGHLRTNRPPCDVWLGKPYAPDGLVRAVLTALAIRSRQRYLDAGHKKEAKAVPV